MFLGQIDKLLQGFHGLPEFLGELFVFLVLPGVAERGKTSMEHAHSIFEVAVEALQLLGETPDFFGVHYCLGHGIAFRTVLIL